MNLNEYNKQMKEEITRERAKELIDKSERGTLILGNRQKVPAIGDVPEEERESTFEIRSYSFGALEEASAGDGHGK